MHQFLIMLYFCSLKYRHTQKTEIIPRHDFYMLSIEGKLHSYVF